MIGTHNIKERNECQSKVNQFSNLIKISICFSTCIIMALACLDHYAKLELPAEMTHGV